MITHYRVSNNTVTHAIFQLKIRGKLNSLCTHRKMNIFFPPQAIPTWKDDPGTNMPSQLFLLEIWVSTQNFPVKTTNGHLHPCTLSYHPVFMLFFFLARGTKGYMSALRRRLACLKVSHSCV